MVNQDHAVGDGDGGGSGAGGAGGSRRWCAGRGVGGSGRDRFGYVGQILFYVWGYVGWGERCSGVGDVTEGEEEADEQAKEKNKSDGLLFFHRWTPCHRLDLAGFYG